VGQVRRTAGLGARCARPRRAGRTLQVACVYGDLTARLLDCSAPGSKLDVVDVLPLQLANLARKLPADSAVNMIRCDSASMEFASGTYDRALLFFLLHEQPEDVRRATIAQTLRVVKPGGRVVIVDYHRPSVLNPLFLPMVGILHTLEPFALDLWRRPITDWFPQRSKSRKSRRPPRLAACIRC
jgi:ubiquinone/menaquinone biosynthesis C-methylase UbiE